jgi:hypothetical protein
MPISLACSSHELTGERNLSRNQRSNIFACETEAFVEDAPVVKRLIRKSKPKIREEARSCPKKNFA